MIIPPFELSVACTHMCRVTDRCSNVYFSTFFLLRSLHILCASFRHRLDTWWCRTLAFIRPPTNAPSNSSIRVTHSRINYAAQSLIASLTSSAPFSSDLEELQNILHFPEEVALRLTDAEYQLYYQVRHINLWILYRRGRQEVLAMKKKWS